MTRRTSGLIACAAALLALTWAATGCGPKPPCQVSQTQVDATKADCAKAQADLEKGRNDRSALESEVSRLKAEIAELESRPADLEARLESLRKGSGR
jgi:septal ring factor EnvC (AmiA/AmiB activator)